MCTQPVILDSTLRSSEAMEFEEALRSKIVSQGEALQAMVNLYQVFFAGLNPPDRPVGSSCSRNPGWNAIPQPSKDQSQFASAYSRLSGSISTSTAV